MILKPVTSEKAVRMIEIDNILLFKAPRQAKKDEIRLEVERLFGVKVAKVRTHIRENSKFAYVKFTKENPAIDVATKLGMM